MTDDEENIDWEQWEGIIKSNKIVIDRAKDTPHPHYPKRVYPIDYGYITNTKGGDNEEIDIFVGTSKGGLVGAILTVDRIKNDKEIKLLWNTSKVEAEAALKFVNYGGMTGTLVWRKSGRAINGV